MDGFSKLIPTKYLRDHRSQFYVPPLEYVSEIIMHKSNMANPPDIEVIMD